MEEPGVVSCFLAKDQTLFMPTWNMSGEFCCEFALAQNGPWIIAVGKWGQFLPSFEYLNTSGLGAGISSFLRLVLLLVGHEV